MVCRRASSVCGKTAAIFPSASSARARRSDMRMASISASVAFADSISPSANAAVCCAPQSVSFLSKSMSGRTAPSSPMRPAASAARVRTLGSLSDKSDFSFSSQRRWSSARMICSRVFVGIALEVLARGRFWAKPAVSRMTTSIPV